MESKEWINAKLAMLDFGFPPNKTGDLNNQFGGYFAEIIINPLLKYARINATAVYLKSLGNGCFNNSSCNGIFDQLVNGKVDFGIDRISPFNVNQSYVEEYNLTGIAYGNVVDEHSIGFGQLNLTQGFVTELSFGLAPIDYRVIILLIIFLITLLIGQMIHQLTYEYKNKKRKKIKSWYKVFDPFSIQRIEKLKFWMILLIFIIHQFLVGLTKSDLVVWVPPKYFESLSEALDSDVKINTIESVMDLAEVKIIAISSDEGRKLLANLREANIFDIIGRMSRGEITIATEIGVSFMRSAHCAITKMKLPDYFMKEQKWIKIDPSYIKFTYWKHLSTLFAYSAKLKGTKLEKRLSKVNIRMTESGYNEKTKELIVITHPHVSADLMYNCLLLKSYKSHLGNDTIYSKAPNQLIKWLIILLISLIGLLFLPYLALFNEKYLCKKLKKNKLMKRKCAPRLPWI